MELGYKTSSYEAHRLKEKQQSHRITSSCNSLQAAQLTVNSGMIRHRSFDPLLQQRHDGHKPHAKLKQCSEKGRQQGLERMRMIKKLTWFEHRSAAREASCIRVDGTADAPGVKRSQGSAANIVNMM